MTSKIALIVPWLGKLPEYFELFAKLVVKNPILSYHFWTDRTESETLPYKRYGNIFLIIYPLTIIVKPFYRPWALI